MANDPGFVFYPGDYLRDTQCLSENSQVAYDRILCEHMRNICITEHQLKFFIKKLNQDEKDELMMVLKKVPDGFQIEWVVESITKRRAYSESRRNNRSKKQKNTEITSKTYDKHMDNEDEIESEDESIIEKEVEYEKTEKQKIDFDKITSIFNSVCHRLPSIQKITQQRKIAIKNRISEYGLSGLGDVFQKVSLSGFLNGENDRGWKADFDWILKPANFIKIKEGKYDDNGKSKQQTSKNRVEYSDDFKRHITERLQSG